MITTNSPGLFLKQRLLELGFINFQVRYIVAQAAFETANFTSPIYLENHNLFGMRYAGQKLALGSKSGYAYYKDDNDSILDYMAYYKLNKYEDYYPSLEAFVSALKSRGYFTALPQDYYKGVKYFMNIYYPDNGV